MSQILVTGEAKIRDIQGPVVANSGVVTALDGAASQYVRGDGTLADFPTSTGGGSSVSYYLNSSVSQGTIGGVAYRELSKEPIIGAGTDIAIAANGYVANYLTDANDPDVLSIPGGNFNCEFYFSVNNNTGNPTTYAELYKYDGTTFTLLGTSAGVPESINQGTTIAPYYFAIPVATAALSVTDRLAIRIYVNVDSRTVTLHTENGHLCQVVTTLSKGMVSLNNLTDQSQYLATGTSGTNFAIVSSGDTHTFNLPVASATNTGKLSSTDWSTFNGKVPYTGAIASVDLGIYSLSASELSANGAGSVAGFLNLKQNTTTSQYLANYSAIGAYSNGYVFNIATPSVSKQALLDLSLITASASRTFTLPDASGTLALTSDISYPVTSVFGRTGAVVATEGDYSLTQLSDVTITTPTNGQVLKYNGTAWVNNSDNDTGITSLNGLTALTQTFAVGTSGSDFNIVSSGSTHTFNIPNASSTNRGLISTGTQTISGVKTFTNSIVIDDGVVGNPLVFKQYSSSGSYGSGYTSIYAIGATTLGISFGASNTISLSSASLTSNRTFTFPDATGTLALTSNLSAYLPLTGGTLTGALSGTSATFSGNFGVGTASPSVYTNLNTITINGTNGSVIDFKTGEVLYGELFCLANELRVDAVGASGVLKLLTNSVPRLTIDSTGAATFSTNSNSTIVNSFQNTNTTNTNSRNMLNVTAGNVTLQLTAIHGDNVYISPSTAVNTFLGFNNSTVITSGGNVGIGTSTINASSGYRMLRINGTSGSEFALAQGDTDYGYMYANSGIFAIATQAAIPMVFQTNATERMRITSGGNVGIGTSSPSYKLHVSGSAGTLARITDGTNNLDFYAGSGLNEIAATTTMLFSTNNAERMRISSVGVIGFNGSSDVANVNDKFSLGYFNSNYGWLQTWSSTALYLNKLGNAVYAGAVRLDTLSDERVKDNIQPIENALSKVLSITGKKFHLKDEDEGKLRYGFIAQELEGVLDEFVIQTDITFKHKELEVENVKSIENWASSWSALLVEAIKEQQAQIEELKALIKNK